MLQSSAVPLLCAVQLVSRAAVQESVAYDESLDDVLVGHNVHCMHPALIVRSACNDNTQAVIIKALRGWDTPAQEFIQDEHSLLRVMARSAAKVVHAFLELPLQARGDTVEN